MSKNKFLGEFEQFVLLAILRLGDQAYGTTIRKVLFDAIQRDVSIGALYTTLTRLEEKGLVRSSLGEATAQRGGRAKKHFEVTAEGRRALMETRQSLDIMWRDIKLSFVGVES